MEPIFPSLEDLAIALKYYVKPSIDPSRPDQAIVANCRRVDDSLLAQYLAGFILEHGYSPRDAVGIACTAGDKLASVTRSVELPSGHILETAPRTPVLVQYKFIHADHVLSLLDAGRLELPHAIFPVVDLEMFHPVTNMYERAHFTDRNIPVFPLITNTQLLELAPECARPRPRYPRMLAPREAS